MSKPINGAIRCGGCGDDLPHESCLVYVARDVGFVCDECATGELVAVARLQSWRSKPMFGTFTGHSVGEMKSLEGRQTA